STWWPGCFGRCWESRWGRGPRDRRAEDRRVSTGDLRPGHLRAVANEDGNRVERHAHRDRAPAAERLRPIPVAPPPAPRQVHGPLALADLPHPRPPHAGAQEARV